MRGDENSIENKNVHDFWMCVATMFNSFCQGDFRGTNKWLLSEFCKDGKLWINVSLMQAGSSWESVNMLEIVVHLLSFFRAVGPWRKKMFFLHGVSKHISIKLFVFSRCLLLLKQMLPCIWCSFLNLVYDHHRDIFILQISLSEFHPPQFGSELLQNIIQGEFNHCKHIMSGLTS